jgi:5-aminopentanamidase
MKIAFYQFAPEFGRGGENLTKIISALSQPAFEADLYVLPELCLSGYQFLSREEALAHAEEIPAGESCQEFIRHCRERNCYIVAGLCERAGDDVFNTSILVGPKGLIGVYRKIHLFWDEKKIFSPGDLPFGVWDIGAARIGMMICFDWIFPEAARSLALAGADIICHPVNLVLPFCQQAMITRCLENGIYAVTANRVGFEERGGRDRLTFTGGSQIVSSRGDPLVRAGREGESLQIIEIDPLRAREKMITPENHILDDRRPRFYRRLYGEGEER